jgi:hypothetical protein
MSRVIKIDVEVTCLCGGKLAAGLRGELVHTKPTCKDYDDVETVDEAADLLARIRRKLEQS